MVEHLHGMQVAGVRFSLSPPVLINFMCVASIAQWIELVRPKDKMWVRFLLGAQLKILNNPAGIEQERGRENLGFPVVEVLKPSGFKERSE